ncbi:hypothetical protein IE53DRAFT_80408 [Violaceomyces palustris]|uniref:Uncharacterized protein n=1 Tax=Violaceomyces palustris TaxID=1673888 RepID=A0ACD0P792_9BASI|nr:hypothetical protein IE53DRAFT_80408 [Violaceomyces palustris]
MVVGVLFLHPPPFPPLSTFLTSPQPQPHPPTSLLFAGQVESPPGLAAGCFWSWRSFNGSKILPGPPLGFWSLHARAVQCLHMFDLTVQM